MQPSLEIAPEFPALPPSLTVAPGVTLVGKRTSISTPTKKGANLAPESNLRGEFT